MAKSAVYLFVIVAIIVIVESNGALECPANKVYLDCPKPLECRPSCSQPDGSEGCLAVCDKAGCVCKDGLVLNDNEECVDKSKCPPKCPANSTYSECPLRKSCRPSCDNPLGTRSCTRECDVANPCVCNPGYLLNSSGKCVLPSDCPNGAPVCPANKVWSECAQLAGCRPSCSQPNGAEVCAAVCTADCICKDGLLLNANGECIDKSSCPPKCPANSTYAECPLSLRCRPSCKNPKGTEICTLECDLANPCVCNPGYLLNSDGKCVQPSQCPNGAPECPANKLWSDCAKLRECRPSCLQPNGTDFCPKICALDCVCKDGLVLNDNGECVDKSKCPPKCPANSTYSDCPLRKSCRPSCDKPLGTGACTRECDVANPCVCNPGYLLNSSGKCVLPSDCPNGAPVCPANKVWSECAQLAGCRPSCSRPNGAEVCAAVCAADCICKDGLLLNANGECIDKSKCPPPKCPANSTYSECPKLKGCRPSCEKPKGAEICATVCDPDNKCVCNSGYLLNKKGECVLKSKC